MKKFPKYPTEKRRLFNRIKNGLDSDPSPLKNLGTFSTPLIEKEAFILPISFVCFKG